jgi:MFS transporter, DHA1 family, inner membrane transport protein
LTGAYLWTAVPAVVVWGACSWGQLVPQQHRLATLAPASAPVVLGLNTSGTYLGMSMAGVIGAAGLPLVGAHNLGLVSAVLVALSLAMSQVGREPAVVPGMAST